VKSVMHCLNDYLSTRGMSTINLNVEPVLRKVCPYMTQTFTVACDIRFANVLRICRDGALQNQSVNGASNILWTT